VVLTTDMVFDAFYHTQVTRGFLHSHSYTGNPLACRAAMATLDILIGDDVLHFNRQRAQYLSALMMPVAEHPAVRNYRHMGMIWAFEVESDNPRFARDFYQAALAKGVVLRPIGNTVYFMPPYVLDDEQMALLADTTLELLG
jgi:adenosylmethionine-8-amino-7-oxononanoate aminotransferase